jgi:putative addiction module component (TIGR02574 family)
MSIDDFPGLAKLTTVEKILLVEQLWDSIRSDEASIPIPVSHKDELDKRIATLKSCRLLTLEELMDRVDKRK